MLVEEALSDLKERVDATEIFHPMKYRYKSFNQVYTGRSQDMDQQDCCLFYSINKLGAKKSQYSAFIKEF
jgi:hypothetical protein